MSEVFNLYLLIPILPVWKTIDELFQRCHSFTWTFFWGVVNK